MYISEQGLKIIVAALKSYINSKEIDAARMMKSEDREKVLRGEVLPCEMKEERGLLARIEHELEEEEK